MSAAIFFLREFNFADGRLFLALRDLSFFEIGKDFYRLPPDKEKLPPRVNYGDM